MKLKKSFILISLFTFLIIIICYLFYNKIYQITINPEYVYEIEIKKSYPYEEIILSTSKEVEKYLSKVDSLKFTHPHINNGKGWSELITIKLINNDGVKSEYRYSLLNDYISIGSLRYKLITK